MRVHDSRSPNLDGPRHIGFYDIAGNTGWVSVGIDHDTASFAVNAIRHWWQTMGHARYPVASSLLITADCGGSNGARVRLWKRELQNLADELSLKITVCHLPPGTSKWNKIEHKLFSFITQNWRGGPPGQLSDHRATDRGNHHADRPQRQMRDRIRHLSHRRQGHQCRDGHNRHHPALNSTASGTCPSGRSQRECRYNSQQAYRFTSRRTVSPVTSRTATATVS